MGIYLFIGTDATQQARVRLEADTGQLLGEKAWECGRGLSNTILAELDALLSSQSVHLNNLSGLGVFAGPAGFTDLRITHAVANALAYGLQIPVVSSGGEAWLASCRQKLRAGENFGIVKPAYGRAASITKRKK